MRHEHAPHTQWHLWLINPQNKNWIQDAMSRESKEPIFPQIGGASRKEYGTLLDTCLRRGRLIPLLPDFVLYDQARFILNRSISHNLRTLFTLLHQLRPNEEAVGIFLKATKCFDSLERPFLFAVLRKIKIPDPYLRMI
ncbi:hypothetical protein NDU88_004234 [Pleurodeles waltl]|uniref:Reverse transcriptase n=1 Tax=Pleurodeles waltl TaxID=8319 RepID=A0AAV7WRA2_PLEWA|nr:hypothetical protein NDU88_004234 [Pleurodeles waltl]